jgi:hypothetical protein
MTTRLLATFLALGAPLVAQLEYYQVVNNEEKAISGLLAMGESVTDEPLEILIRVKNTGRSMEILTTLSVAGSTSGFTLIKAPDVPIGIVGGFSIDFYVRFLTSRPVADARGNLRINSTTISLQASAGAAPGLYLLESDGTRTRKLVGVPSLFGTINRDARATRSFVLENSHDTIVIVPSLSLSGDAFSFTSLVVLPLRIAPRQSVNLEIVFQPRTTGITAGALMIDQRRYPVEGSAREPATPKPLLTVGSEIGQSGKQAHISVKFDAPARTTAAGRLRVEFNPQFLGPDDPGVLFPSTNSRSVVFSVVSGESEALFSGDQRETLLQTGTTAGTLRVIAEMGGFTAESTYTIPPAPVMVDTVMIRRGVGALELTVQGFDNSRSASEVAFTFFDDAGQPVQPGQLRVDVTEKVKKYFEAPPAGGMFSLFASFTATGSTAQVAAAELEFRNATGSSRTERIIF